MKTQTLGILLFTLSASFASADALWDKAVGVVEATRSWMAHSSSAVTLDLNDKGGVNETTQMETVYSLNEKGWMARQNVKLIKNGKDEQPDAVAKASEPPKEPNDPLLAAAQPFTKTSVPTAGTWNGRPVQIYPYTFQPKSGSSLKGRLWIDTETGVALHRESIADPPPAFVKTSFFVQDAVWDPRGFSPTTHILVDIEGSFLGFTKHWKITTDFKDYVRKP